LTADDAVQDEQDFDAAMNEMALASKGMRAVVAELELLAPRTLATTARNVAVRHTHAEVSARRCRPSAMREAADGGSDPHADLDADLQRLQETRERFLDLARKELGVKS
jgi:hypothetical protein